MDQEFLPLFNPDDYEAFRHILGPNLPNTYDEWLQLHAEHRADLQRKGHIVRDVNIYPDEFARFLRSHGQVANRTALRDFTIEKAHGNTY